MKLPRIMAFARPDSPSRVTLVYILVGAGWILGSDWWMAWRTDAPFEVLRMGTVKGLLFILATAAMLYGLIKRLDRRHLAVEKALRENEQRLKLVLAAGNQGLFDWKIPTGAVEVNDIYAQMLGYDPADFRETYATWADRLHPGDRAMVIGLLQEYLAGRVPDYRVEYRMKNKAGGWVWVLGLGCIIKWAADGRPERMIGTHTDITEKKSAETRIMDTLAFAKTILNNAPIGVIVYGPDGRTVTANEAAAQLAGTDVPGLLRQNFREIETWRRHGLLAAAEEALASGRQVVLRGPFQSSFGRSGWIEARFKPFYYQDATHLLLLITDESEKQRAVAHLHLLDAAVQAAPVGWVVTDADGTINSVNPGFTKLTGYTAAEVVGRSPRILKSGRHLPEFYATMWATIKRGEVWSGEMFNQRKDGGLYHEFMTIAPVRDESGAIAHFVAIKQDITDRKALENQLARAQRLEGIGMLASGIAHDLNNIFAPILLSLELLKLKYPMADARRMLDTIESAGQRGAGIVKQVLTFARGIEGERTEVQPKYLVKEMAQILGETLPRNIRVETELAASLSPVLGDATQLHQVLLNLAINARDAMPVGGRLVLGAADVLVDESRAARNPPLKPGRCVAFTVTDTGSGIPPEVLERMFEPFFTTKPLGKGTGLGLSTVYGIVRSHGGAVEVKTKVGEGTEFSVLLPAMPGGIPEPEAPRSTSERIHGAGRRILVVDDEDTIRIVTAAALQRHGFVVETAEDGAEGLMKFLRRSDFAAVVTDLMMPQMNGYEMAREIRRHDPRVPILASSGMTGDSGSSGPETGLAALGIKTLLTKPYTEEHLLRALAAELAPVPLEKKD